MRGSVRKYSGKRGTTWLYVIDVGTKPDGRRDQRTRRGFPTKKAATEAMQAELVARRSPHFIEPSKERTEAYLRRWLLDTAPSRAVSTQFLYETHVALISAQLGHVRLGDLTAVDVQAAVTALSARLAPTTLALTRNVLSGALRQAVRWRLIAFNPAEHVVMPELRVADVPVWAPEEARTALASAVDHDDYPLWRLLLDTGMRLGEALALGWDLVDLEGGAVTIRRTLAIGEDARPHVAERTKTKGSRRTIAIEEATVEALRRHRRRQAERRLAAWQWHDAGLVFDRGDGRFLWPQTAQRRLKRLCHEAGVTVVTPKGLRHTAATIMVASGVPLHAVSKRLGHSSITLTANLYAHMTPEADRLAAQALARVLEG